MLMQNFIQIFLKTIFSLFLVCFTITSFNTKLKAEKPLKENFQATWNLLNSQEKQQFLSGYLHAWKEC